MESTFHLKSVVRLLLVLQQACMVCQAISFSNITDHSALLAFKSAISYDPNNVLANNWNESTSFCNWVGVKCSQRRQRVTVLSLGSMGLEGTISPHLGNLSFLITLTLPNNSLRGSLPRELGQLRRLKTLWLPRNQLEGKIPISLQHCQHLQVMSLTYNQFTGGFPIQLTTLSSLRRLYLGGNSLKGTLPPSLGNLSNIQVLAVEGNYISGSIPSELANLTNLKAISLYDEYLTGSIPPGIFNISSLQYVRFALNALSGSLASTTGLLLPNLEILELRVLNLQSNKFSGPIPTNLGQLHLLENFNVAVNQLTRELESLELGFLTALTNCSSLQYLLIAFNPLVGILPNSIGNFSSSLEWFDAARCQLTGLIPVGIGSLHVNALRMSENYLYGTIPSTIGNMPRLQGLNFKDNNISGSIPDEMCILRTLVEIRLQHNKLLGPIPSCIGNLSRLQMMVLSNNSLTSIPPSFWMLDNLLLLNLSFNSLRGKIETHFRALKNLESIDLSWNRFFGNVPSNIGAFQNLRSLNLSGNSFSGPIPKSLGDLITLDFLDLSHNNLSGTIPKSLEGLSHLGYLNLSFNRLSGEIPSGGPFTNFTAHSFMENEALCGHKSLQVLPCTNPHTQNSWTKKFLEFIIPAITLVVIFAIVAIVFILKKYIGNQLQNVNQVGLFPGRENMMISYQELCLATNNFYEANLLGVGSFGSVYKGVLSDNTTVAVKNLNLQVKGAFKSFDAECKVLRSVRHRNLVKVISTCSNPELRALVLQYMPNGSLEKWLYSHNYCLDLLQRISIMHDVAVALEYLHHGHSEPVVHCDLKPTNVLLDEDMVAHVGDFGIARILVEDKTATQTKTLGTIGYIAPEYGSEGRVSTKGDIYSFGIMLFETFTRKRPTDEMFNGKLSLRQWVDSSLPRNVNDVVDCGLLSNIDGDDVHATKDFVLAILKLGLGCSKELPEERSDIKDVVAKLNKIKLKLLRNQNS